MPIFNKNKTVECFEFINDAFEKEKRVKVEIVSEKRTLLQNSSLHLFFTILADQLNENGIDYRYYDIEGQVISIPFNSKIVKEYIWRPIQKTVFNIESTKDLTTKMINEILDILCRHFGVLGIPVKFPNNFDRYLQMYKN